MDVEWCLACERHLDSSGPLCFKCSESKPTIVVLDSEFSVSEDDDDEILLHDVHDVQPPAASWRTKEKICAWAAGIPVGSAAGAPSCVDFNATYPIPALLKGASKPLMPSLCMSIPGQNKPFLASKPIMSPQQHISSISISSSLAEKGSVPTSSATESSVCTPSSNPIQIPSSSKPSILGTFTSHVRSWVGSPLPSRKVPSPAAIKASKKPFAVFAQCHEPSQGIRIVTPPVAHEEDLSSVSSTIDLDKVWWETSPPHSPSRTRVINIDIKKPRTEDRTRAVGATITPVMRSRDEHPAYRSRGRKTSKVVA